MTAEINNQSIEQRTLSTLRKQTQVDEYIMHNVYRLIIHAENLEVIGSPPIQKTGTGFTIFEDKEVYLVTAAHLFDGIHVDNVSNSISIQFMNEFKKIKVIDSKIGQYGSGEKDVAVFKVDGSSLCRLFDYDNRQVNELAIDMFTGNEYLNIGDQIIFVGYPSFKGEIQYHEYGIPEGKHTGFPRMFMKIGYLSYFSQDPHRYYIDGAPNYGFSGGPVMWRNENNEFRYIGVVSRGADDGSKGGLTMVCEPIHTVGRFIDELKVE